MNYDVLTVGNAIVDAILGIQPDSPFVHLHKGEKELRIASGQKIPAESCGTFPGGNACNVAVGLSRAGIKTGLVAQMADDELANHSKRILEKEGVSLEYVTKSQGSTVLNIAINFRGDRTLFTHHVNQPHNFNLEKAKTKLLYLTSLGSEWRHIYKMIAKFVQQEGVILAFNPGSVQLGEGVDSFSYLLPLTTILFVNKEEAEIIAGEKGAVRHLLTSIQAKGPKIVSITNGELGAYAIDQHGTIYEKEAEKCSVVERTGAGDAFASGFLAAYLHGHDIDQSITWGIHNGASVIGQYGAQAGLLTKDEMEQRL